MDIKITRSCPKENWSPYNEEDEIMSSEHDISSKLISNLWFPVLKSKKLKIGKTIRVEIGNDPVVLWRPFPGKIGVAIGHFGGSPESHASSPRMHAHDHSHDYSNADAPQQRLRQFRWVDL